jgi:hypothetical protein
VFGRTGHRPEQATHQQIDDSEAHRSEPPHETDEGSYELPLSVRNQAFRALQASIKATSRTWWTALD